MKKQTILRSTIAGIFAIGAGLAANNALAGVPDAPKNWEKCAGVAKAGMNDCGSFDGKHKCAGQATEDNSEHEWVYLPEGTCAKIGGLVKAVKPAK